MEQDVNITPEQANEPKTFNVKVGTDANGEPIMQTVNEDELIGGYLRQSDYTRKTQELAEERKQQSQKAQDAGYRGDPNDDEQVEQYLQSKGYAKLDTVEKLVEEKLKGMTKSQQDEQSINSVIAANPELKQFEGAIRKIAATDNSAIEDIVVKYGFSTHDKLSEAKKRGVIGNKGVNEDKPKSIMDMSEKEFAEFEAKHKQSSFR